ncbi:glycosyl hydrolase [Insulibacter thermoxylanivorax]|uniref:Glycosyl hydrolase n=1 Tax=Insulibacter thermoxylanivorax TaxID=2749268 RepID=A0A916QIL2_9BACL|nr:glycoside hydrolase family 3 C-terminal domain-containing protein [Insulibacter thermoxylanivorax]GFR39117.1 glycosyl hydrolase [Insulibacter thermoxylanivorax]
MAELQRNPEKIAEYKKRAAELVSQMTLDEKIRQMLHAAPAIERLGVKAYNWWNEALHGVARAGTATVFPQAIGLAATFDEELMEKIADAIATEGRAKYNMQQEFGDTDIYKGLTFWSPNVNIFRDPRWGRGHETYGEDPYLTSRLGVRFIQGLQGKDENYLKAAACAKHFAVHSGPEGLRHSFNAVVSKQDMYETYLPAFEACVKEAKVEAVMGAYNRTNGEPCCGSETLLVKILRGDWGFDGHVVSDCWAIKDFHEYHKVTKNEVESVALAVNMGCDLNCGSLFVFLKDAIEQGLVTEEQIDQAVTRLMTTRMKLGMFDDPEKVPFSKISYKEVDSPEMREFNLQVSRQTLTLLKNENNILPLDKSKIKTIGVIGPNANNRKALVGNYEGTASRYITPLEGIQDYVGDDVRVLYSEGCDLFKDRVSVLSTTGNDRISEVKGVCKESDVIIVCLGLDADLEGEEGDTGNQFASGDKPDLRFPGLQEEVLKVCYESGKPVILLVLAGSAMDLSWADEHIPAIVQCWYPGAQGGRAIAELLFGEYSPEGKLPVTFYRSTEELPEFTDYSMKGRTYRYMEQDALYPFGYGLSYTNFELSDVKVDTDKVTDAGVTVTAKIRNTGQMRGGETVQVYVKVERDGTPNPQLKGLKKVHLDPQEEQEVTIHLPLDAFGLYDEEAIKRVYAGEFSVYVGTTQPDRRSRALTGKEPVKLTLTADEEVVLSKPPF